MDDYLLGTDVLAGEDDAAIVGASLPSNPNGPFVTIHVKNVADLVAKQGGAAGSFAARLVPQTIENTVYSEMAKKIGDGMKLEGVDADIKVVSNKPAVGGAPQDFSIGAVAGVAISGALYGLVKLVQHFRR